MYKIYKRKVPKKYRCYWIIENTLEDTKAFVFDISDTLNWKASNTTMYSHESYELYTEASTEEELLPAMKMIAMIEGKVGKYE